jgi:uncharacterized protein
VIAGSKTDHRCADVEIGEIGAKVGFLGSPKAYAEKPLQVEVIETHFSWVFLTDKHVFKLKKPVRNGGIDLSSLAARRRNAEQEVRLNRRLADDVYVGVVPLTLGEGGLILGGTGPVVDWVVKMQRLPPGQMLDVQVASRNWRRGEIQALAARLAEFFATARRADVQPHRYVERFRRECRLSRRAFQRVDAHAALRATAANVARRLEAFMSRRGQLLASRAVLGRIVDGHGDLRPEHVWLGPQPLVIDCLEFRADLRRLDPVDELAFLAMECDRLGAAVIGPILFHRYRLRTGDDPPRALIWFYKAVSALIRARLAILHLQERPVRDPQKWPARAAQYLGIADRETRQIDTR